MIRMIHMCRACHDTQDCLLSKYGRQNGYTDIDLSFVQCHTEMSVLWDTLLCDIQIGQNLDTCDQWSVDILLDLHIFRHHAVDTHAYGGLFFKWFDMDIAGFCLDRTLDQTVQESDDRCFIICIFQILDLKFINRTHCIKSYICLLCGFSCIDLCIVIRHGLLKRCFFT